MKKLVICLFAVTWLASCKDDEQQTCNKDMAGIAGTYRITAVKYKANASASEVDYYNFFFTDACEKDDNIVLNANGTATFNDAGTACSPPNNYSATWSVSGNTLTLDGDPANIDNFNCSTMTVSVSDYFNPGDKIILTFTRL